LTRDEAIISKVHIFINKIHVLPQSKNQNLYI